jgi:hypothetical protein
VEDALERGEETVSPEMAAAIQAHSLAVDLKAGLPLCTALEIVFEEQGRQMADPPNCVDACVNPGRLKQEVRIRRPASLTEGDARNLTMRIKAGMKDTCLLLLEAHDRCAWRSLGYASWERYVYIEFGYSRSRSYEFLDQGRVVLAIQQALGSVAVPYISAYTASQIKPRIGEITDEISQEIARVGEERWSEIACNIIQQNRAQIRGRVRLAKSHPPRAEAASEVSLNGAGPIPSPIGSTPITPGQLIALLEYLGNLPPCDQTTLEVVGAGCAQIELLDKAVAWLTTLRSLWLRHDGRPKHDHHRGASQGNSAPIARPGASHEIGSGMLSQAVLAKI